MVIVAVLISAVAAAAETVIGLLCLAFAQAPGWRHLRWFAGVALTAAAYSLGDLAFVWPSMPAEVVLWAGRLNFLWAPLHVIAWIGYSRVQIGDRIHRWERVLMVGYGLLGLAALVPGAALENRLTVQVVQSWDLQYRVVATTWLGDLTAATSAVGMLIPFARYVRRSRAGVAGARVHLATFAVFYALAVNEVLVSMQVVEAPYLVDIGFLAIVLAVSGEMARRVTRDAKALTRLTEELERVVEERTRDLTETRDALVRSERIAAVGQLAAGIGHEINNPLTYVSANVEHARGLLGGRDPETDQALSDALEGSKRIGRIVQQLKLFGRGSPTEQREPVDVNATVRSSLRFAEHDIRHRATVETHLDELPPVLGDASQLGQVLVNLLINAAHAFRTPDPAHNRIVVRSSVRDGWVVVEVEDNGVGIPHELLERIFEPYFTTKQLDHGTGLGLSVVQGIVRSHGGQVQVESDPGRSTLFRLRLPAYQTPQERRSSLPPRRSRRPEQGAPPLEPTAPPRVLLIDDDPLVARALKRCLRGYTVEIAQGGRQGLDRLAEDPDIDVIICDLMMPDLSGMDVHAWIAQERPELLSRTVFITGGTVTDRASRFLDRPDVRWVPKPIEPATLRAVVRERLTSAEGDGLASHSRLESASIAP